MEGREGDRNEDWRVFRISTIFSEWIVTHKETNQQYKCKQGNYKEATASKNANPFQKVDARVDREEKMRDLYQSRN